MVTSEPDANVATSKVRSMSELVSVSCDRSVGVSPCLTVIPRPKFWSGRGCVSRTTTPLSEAVAGRSGNDALRACCLAYRRFAAGQPGVYAAIQPSVHTPETDQRARAAGEALLAVLNDVLGAYGLVGDDALDAVRALRSALHGFALLEQTGAFGMPIGVDESFDRLVGMLAGGLSSVASR